MDTFNNHYTNNSFTSKQNNNQPVKRFSPITKRRKINLKKLVTILVVFLLVIFGASKIVSKIRNPQAKNQTETNRPSQKITLNKSFEFIALDSSKDEEEKIEMTLTTAEITNEVLVQDKTFRSKDDKAFLIVNLELKNDNERQLNIFPGDLVRLTVGGEDKKFAPDLHNNVVLIRPISTKIDRLGFVIQTGAKNLKLLVGAVDAKKETVPLNFGP
jgi:hypothetical protein